MKTTRVSGALLFALALALEPSPGSAQAHDDDHTCDGEEGDCGGGEEGGCEDGDEGGCEGGHEDGCEGGHEGGGGNGHGGPGPMVCRTDLVSGRDLLVVGYLVVRERRCVEGGFNVTFHADPGFCLFETHLHVEDAGDPIPVTRKDVPVPGLFEYAQPHACVDRVRYPLDAFAPGTVLAAQAVLLDDQDRAYGAWAEGTPFGGRTWAMFVTCGVAE